METGTDPENRGAVSARIENVRGLVQEGDLDLAIRRLLDCARDFSTSRELRNEVVLLSGKHNLLRTEIRRFDLNPETRRERDVLSHRLLELADELEGGFAQDRSGLTPPPNVGAASPGDGKATGSALASGFPPEARRDEAKRNFLARGQALSGSGDAPVPVFRCADLGKIYARSTVPFALRNVSLELRLGHITAVVGGNGQGKTTLLEIVAGRLQQSSGSIEYPLLLPDRRIDWRQVKMQVEYIPHALRAWGRATLEVILRFTAAAFGKTGTANDDEVEFMLHRLGLERFRDATWFELSAGFRLRGAIARALLSFPKLLILDEPLANLDISTRRLLLQDVRDLTDAQENPLSVIVTSHHVDEIETIADEMLVLDDGQPVFYGLKEDLRRQRSLNIFEIGCDPSNEAIVLDWATRARLQVSRSGSGFELRAPLALGMRELLADLSATGAQINYFRDISGSARPLLRPGK